MRLLGKKYTKNISKSMWTPNYNYYIVVSLFDMPFQNMGH